VSDIDIQNWEKQFDEQLGYAFDPVQRHHIKAFISQLLKEKDKQMKQQLTHKLDMAEMLEGWEGDCIHVGGGRYVENCLECENATKIINALLSITPQEGSNN
jgi:hypothetical protein